MNMVNPALFGGLRVGLGIRLPFLGFSFMSSLIFDSLTNALKTNKKIPKLFALSHEAFGFISIAASSITVAVKIDHHRSSWFHSRVGCCFLFLFLYFIFWVALITFAERLLEVLLLEVSTREKWIQLS